MKICLFNFLNCLCFIPFIVRFILENRKQKKRKKEKDNALSFKVDTPALIGVKHPERTYK